MASYGYLPCSLNLKENGSEKDWCLRVSNIKQFSLFIFFLQHQRNACFPFPPVALSAADLIVFLFFWVHCAHGIGFRSSQGELESLEGRCDKLFGVLQKDQ